MWPQRRPFLLRYSPAGREGSERTKRALPSPAVSFSPPILCPAALRKLHTQRSGGNTTAEPVTRLSRA